MQPPRDTDQRHATGPNGKLFVPALALAILSSATFPFALYLDAITPLSNKNMFGNLSIAWTTVFVVSLITAFASRKRRPTKDT